MPGDLMTTSQAASRSRPPSTVATTSPVAGLSSTRTAGWTPSVASLRRLADPSTPRPQTPTRRPARSDQEIVGGIRPLDEVLPEPAHQGTGLRHGAGGQDLLAEGRQQRVARAVGPLAGQQHRRPALPLVADALEGLGDPGVAEQAAEPVDQVGPLQRLAPAEDRAQLLRRHEG